MHARLRKENENKVRVTEMPCTSCLERSRCQDGGLICRSYMNYIEKVQRRVNYGTA